MQHLAHYEVGLLLVTSSALSMFMSTPLTLWMTQ